MINGQWGSAKRVALRLLKWSCYRGGGLHEHGYQSIPARTPLRNFHKTVMIAGSKTNGYGAVLGVYAGLI